MIIPIEKPGTPEELVHFGVKGMRWGVRKEYQATSSTRSNSNIPGSEHFPKIQAVSMNNVAEKMNKAYGLQIDEFIPLDKNQEKRGIAFITAQTKGTNIIHMNIRPDLVKVIKENQDKGWFVSSIKGREIESVLTHESGHALFHSVNVEGKGYLGRVRAKSPIDNIRINAWIKASEQARKDGDVVSKRFRPDDPIAQMSKKLSKYANSSIFFEEKEAELFSAYHWSPNPPKFVDVFMNSIHNDMGKNVQPFSGRKVTHAS